MECVILDTLGAEAKFCSEAQIDKIFHRVYTVTSGFSQLDFDVNVV